MTFHDVKICSIVSLVGSKKSFVPDNITKTTGIKSLYSLPLEQDATDLGIEAAKAIFEDNSKSHSIISSNAALIFITQTPRYKTPSSAFIIQEAIKKNFRLAFDVNLGCSAFPAGLQLATSLLSSKAVDDVIIVIADTLHRYAQNNQAVASLFSDAASAIHLQRGYCSSVFDHGVDGSNHKAISCEHDGHINMAGLEVYSFAKNVVPASILKVLATSLDQRPPVILHQANQMINQAIEKSVNRTVSRMISNPHPLDFPSTLHKFGNTAGSSIPITICDQFSGTELRIFIASGFGVGLSWGSVAWNQLTPIKLSPVRVLSNP